MTESILCPVYFPAGGWLRLDDWSAVLINRCIEAGNEAFHTGTLDAIAALCRARRAGAR